MVWVAVIAMNYLAICTQYTSFLVAPDLTPLDQRLDTETGVNYIYHTEMYAGGMTPLLGPDGNVVITPREEIESMTKTDEE